MRTCTLQHQRRHPRRYPNYPETASSPIYIRIGDPSNERFYREVVVYSEQDRNKFLDAVYDTLTKNPGKPLIITVSDWRDWLDDILASCVAKDVRNACRIEISERNQEVQKTDLFRFPERHVVGDRDTVTWSFVIDHINVPQAYWWSVHLDFPSDSKGDDRDGQHRFQPELYRLRLAVWTCGEGVPVDRESDITDHSGDTTDTVAMTLIFIQSANFPDQLSTRLHEHLFKDVYQSRDDTFEKLHDQDFRIYWIFLRLWNLFTDWENLIMQFETRLDAAETNSLKRHGTASIRTQECHEQIGQIYFFQQFLRFHLRAFSVLDKYRETKIKAGELEAGSLQLWLLESPRPNALKNMKVDDAWDDLSQFQEELQLLIDRFKNLTEYEFNIDNAKMAEHTRFLTIIATIFIPLTFLASIWGMTEFHGSPILFVYVATPITVLVAVAAPNFPKLMRLIWVRRTQHLYPNVNLRRMELMEKNVRLLGEEIPRTQERIVVAKEENGSRR